MKLACKIGLRVFILVVMVRCYPEPIQIMDQPSRDLSAQDVVYAQLTALQKNNEPTLNSGIRTAYNFASPFQRAETGPFKRYKSMYSSRRYATLVENKDFKIREHYLNDKKAEYFVFVTDKFDRNWAFIFRLSQQNKSPYRNCWMTDEILAYADERAFNGAYYKA